VHNVTIVVEEYIVENPVFVYHSGGEGECYCYVTEVLVAC